MKNTNVVFLLMSIWSFRIIASVQTHTDHNSAPKGSVAFVALIGKGPYSDVTLFSDDKSPQYSQWISRKGSIRYTRLTKINEKGEKVSKQEIPIEMRQKMKHYRRMAIAAAKQMNLYKNTTTIQGVCKWFFKKDPMSLSLWFILNDGSIKQWV